MISRRYGFTAFALLASLAWIVVMVADDQLNASEMGRAYIGVARILFIPLYVLQTLVAIAMIALRGGPPTAPSLFTHVFGVIQWILSIVPFVLMDWLRARRSGPR